MAKITKVSIINENTLRIEEDAKAGDIIDLRELKNVDTSSINEVFAKFVEEATNKKLEEIKKTTRIEEQNKFIQKENELNSQIEGLKNQLTFKDKDYTLKLTKEKEGLQKEIDVLNNTIKSLQNNQEMTIKTKENEIESKYKDQINALNNDISLYKERLASDVKTIKLETEKAKNEEIAELKDKYRDDKEKWSFKENDLKSQIDQLKLQKSSLNIKKLGEDLEQWCLKEYENYSVSGFDNCTFNKTNIAIKEENETKGTKPDFEFRCYADADKKIEITSVCLEMKNEAIDSTNKKKNEDHYAKLDKDREKYNCEFALLVSELEWDHSNDSPIVKVSDYKNMYRVRPQYFITFLSIINNIATKYKDAINYKATEEEKFKDSKEILEEFEKFKESYLDKPLEKLNNRLDKIKDASLNIRKQNDTVISLVNEIIDDTLTEMKTKIDRFDIKKIARKVDKVN